MKDPNPVEIKIGYLSRRFDVPNFRQKSIAEKSTVSPCTTDYYIALSLKHKIYQPNYLYFQQRKFPDF